MSENNEKVLAEDFLAQAYRIDQQIQCKVDQLSRIRAICGCPATGFANARVQSSGQTSRVEDMVVKIMDEERAINEEIDRLVDTRCRIRQVIDRMPNDDWFWRSAACFSRPGNRSAPICISVPAGRRSFTGTR